MRAESQNRVIAEMMLMLGVNGSIVMFTVGNDKDHRKKSLHYLSYSVN